MIAYEFLFDESFLQEATRRWRKAWYGKSRTELSWAAFTSGRQFSDGLLLFRGPQFFNWFPDRFLVEGTPYAAAKLVQSKVKSIEVL